MFGADFLLQMSYRRDWGKLSRVCFLIFFYLPFRGETSYNNHVLFIGITVLSLLDINEQMATTVVAKRSASNWLEIKRSDISEGVRAKLK